LINFFKNFYSFLKFKINEKNFNRIIFNENVNTLKYLKDIIKLNKRGTCVISIENLETQDTGNINYFHFNNYFFLSLIFFFLRTKFLYSSTPDLNFTLFRKSFFKKTKYVYIQHSPVSLSMAYKEKAFINFNAVQVINKNQYSDLLDINKFYKKKIRPIKSKYYFVENSLKNTKTLNTKIDYLIAPTWNTDFYKLNLHKHIFNTLKELNKSFVFRPHYMSVKKKEFLFIDLDLKKENIDINSDLIFQNYQNLISDWSGIYLEFAMVNKRKPILINSKMKVRNDNFKKFTINPIELELRDDLAIQFEAHNIDLFKKFISHNNLDEKLSIKFDLIQKLLY
tara:strand:+ start:300 stop:1313 length:1014 start_codon:yes stop_codon:yes gene_type:complete